MKSENTIRVDFLFLDLETCTRCLGTDRSLESALATVRELLEAAGTEVEVNKVHVQSSEQARALRFVSSPTIRVNDVDVALELRESSCGSEACTDGCGGSVSCRVWVHDGQEFTEPPPAMIVDAILREVYRGATVRPRPQAGNYELPENLERFFAGRTTATTVPDEVACCSPSEQQACCDPADKAECCGSAAGGSCGCR